jgi:hypothetical protein
VDYLLSFIHRDGRHKAAFFTRFGFSAGNWEIMATALLRHAAENEVAGVEDSPFGKRYVIEGELNTPDGRNPEVRVVWFIAQGASDPWLVTAYPL